MLNLWSGCKSRSQVKRVAAPIGSLFAVSSSYTIARHIFRIATPLRVGCNIVWDGTDSLQVDF